MGLAALVVFRVPLRVWVVAAASFLATYLPWLVFQKVIDPPGDRLLKWMLAGHTQPTDRSFVDVLSSAYANIKFDDWVDGRLANLAVIGADAVGHTKQLLGILFQWSAQPAGILEGIRDTKRILDLIQ